MAKKVLVPVDFSEHTSATVSHAAALAKQLGAELHLLHVWEVPEFVPPEAIPATGEGSLPALVEASAKTHLRSFNDQLTASGIAVAGATTEQGTPSRAIIDAARSGGFDLVVLGTHGRTGLAHAFIGSVAERVIRHGTVPVLTLTPEAARRAPRMRRILVPVDYSDCSGAALKHAREVASTLGAELDVVHVWDRPPYVSDTVVVHTASGEKRPLGELIREAAEDDMTSFLKAQGGTPVAGHRLLSGEPAATILEELGKSQHDLVIVGTHGRTGLKHLLLGSIAEKLVRHASVPVITVPRSKA
jgi:nucleotide-binding universal stress UspA family protein